MTLQEHGRLHLATVSPSGDNDVLPISLVERRLLGQAGELLGALTQKTGLFEELTHPTCRMDPAATLVSSLVASSILDPEDDEIEMNLSGDANDAFIIAAAHLKAEVESPVHAGSPNPVIDIVTIDQGSAELLALFYMPDPETISPVKRALFFRRDATREGHYYPLNKADVPFWRDGEEASTEHFLWSALLQGECTVEGMSVISVEFLHPEWEEGPGGPDGGIPSPLPYVA